MKYKILSIVDKPTSTGKPRKIASLSNETGNFDGVGLWSDFLNFSSLVVGMEVDGELKTNGQYVTLYPPRNPSARTPGGSGQGFGGAMKAKQEGIAIAQDRKEAGIEMAASFRSATEFVVNGVQFKEMDADEKKKSWLMWRKWFHDNYSDLTGGRTSDGSEMPPF